MLIYQGSLFLCLHKISVKKTTPQTGLYFSLRDYNSKLTLMVISHHVFESQKVQCLTINTTMGKTTASKIMYVMFGSILILAMSIVYTIVKYSKRVH